MVAALPRRRGSIDDAEVRPGRPAGRKAAGRRTARPEVVIDHLVAERKIEPADAERASDLADATHHPLSVVLDRLGLVAEADWAAATAKLNGLRHVRLEEMPRPLPSHPRLDIAFLRHRGIAPFDLAGDPLVFAVSDPADDYVMRALRVATGRSVAFVVAAHRDIGTALAGSDQQAAEGESDSELSERDTDHLLELANDAPTVKLVDSIFAAALERRATDIHVEPLERSGRVRLRVDGMLSEQFDIPLSLYPGVISRLKILAGLDIAERRLPQDGRIKHRSHGREFDVRVATVPSIHGESIALRLLRQEAGVGVLKDLRLPVRAQRAVEWGLAQRNGIVLVTGPTGSGKTTTLHVALSELNAIGSKIISVENPVEIQVPGVIQVEARPEIGFDFPAALRTLLRHDPDVMLVGEIRDRETATVAIQSALTGHLVLSTLHTNDASSAVTRLVDMGIERYLIAATLRLAVAQRLVRCLCPDCAIPTTQSETVERLFAQQRDALPAGYPITLKAPRGCPKCHGTGYRGRRAVFEAISAEGGAIGNEALPPSASMFGHALQLAAGGVTSVDEVLRVLEVPARRVPPPEERGR